MSNRDKPQEVVIPKPVFVAMLLARTARTAREQAAIGGK